MICIMLGTNQNMEILFWERTFSQNGEQLSRFPRLASYAICLQHLSKKEVSNYFKQFHDADCFVFLVF